LAKGAGSRIYKYDNTLHYRLFSLSRLYHQFFSSWFRIFLWLVLVSVNSSSSLYNVAISPCALRFFGKIFEIEMLSPGGARTHDRGQLSKLFPINLNARGESPRCMFLRSAEVFFYQVGLHCLRDNSYLKNPHIYSFSQCIVHVLKENFCPRDVDNTKYECYFLITYMLTKTHNWYSLHLDKKMRPNTKGQSMQFVM